MIEYIQARVQLADVFGHAPGECCPGIGCNGTIAKIVAVWDKDSFMADAVCGTCDEHWPLIEEPGPEPPL